MSQGNDISRVARDDKTVFCNLRAATVLSRKCCADLSHPSTKKVMSYSRDGPSVTAPLPKNRCAFHWDLASSNTVKQLFRIVMGTVGFKLLFMGLVVAEKKKHINTTPTKS